LCGGPRHHDRVLVWWGIHTGAPVCVLARTRPAGRTCLWYPACISTVPRGLCDIVPVAVSEGGIATRSLVIISSSRMSDLNKRSKKPARPQWGKALTLIDAQNELGSLKTVVDVERWLDRMPLLARVGRLRSQYVTGSLLNALRTWCRSHAGDVPPERMQSLERRIASIQNTIGRHQTSPATLTTTTRRAVTNAARGGEDQRVRSRRRLADRRSGTDCRSGADRRQASRRKRESNGRRSGRDRRNGSGLRRTGLERRRLRDRRGLAP